MRSKSSFRQTDVTRAVKGVQAANEHVARVEIVDGKIIIITGKPNEAKSENEWDEVFENGHDPAPLR
jgi:hypothetical protein